jgi:hypothetical protein|tara:strand:- start:2166 stop:2342 length:177 start_codon:yes stop_codon:yes gene_type:complete
MAVAINRYFDGNTFCQATGIFTDNRMTSLAPTGYYAFDGYVRYWDSATQVLGPCSTCP